jgi:hypothetical protein
VGGDDALALVEAGGIDLAQGFLEVGCEGGIHSAGECWEK